MPQLTDTRYKTTRFSPQNNTQTRLPWRSTTIDPLPVQLHEKAQTVQQGSLFLAVALASCHPWQRVNGQRSTAGPFTDGPGPLPLRLI